jgi:exopolysaccharide production protein ExoZ
MIATSQNKATEKFSFHTIQVLRFLAAFMVVTTHSSFAIHDNYDAQFPGYALGGNGVNIFFAISGFVMIVSSQKLVGTAEGWRIFLAHRLLRIVPLYWLITTFKIMMVLVASSFFVVHSEIDVEHIVKSYLFLPALNTENFYRPIVGVGWTLNLEMFFYAIFAASLFLRLPRFAFASLILVLLVLVPATINNYWPVIGFYADIIVLNFIWGMAVATLYLKGFRLGRYSAATAMVLGLVYLCVPNPLQQQWAAHFLLNNIAVFAAMLGAVSLEPLVKDFLGPQLRFYGDASYSLYLTHTSVVPIVPLLLKKFGLFNPMLSLVGSITLALTVGALVFVFIEKPMTQKLKSVMQKTKLVAA